MGKIAGKAQVAATVALAVVEGTVWVVGGVAVVGGVPWLLAALYYAVIFGSVPF